MLGTLALYLLSWHSTRDITAWIGGMLESAICGAFPGAMWCG